MNCADHIYIESANGGKEFELSSIHAAEGRIYITDHIDMDAAMSLTSLMKYMAAEKKAITLYINSTGGDVEAGLVMYDLIQSYPYDLDIYCVGIAASMAALLLASGKKGHRYILPHSKVLIHEPLISRGFGGSATTNAFSLYGATRLSKSAVSLNFLATCLNTVIYCNTANSSGRVSIFS